MRGLVLLLVLLYIISPVDAIPDVIPVAGWADDLVALLIGLGVLVGGGGDRPRIGPR